jgi:membrane protein involved in colicin uptake
MKNYTSKGMTSFTDLSVVDPAVESLLGQGQRRQDEARLPRTERSRKKKERERAEKRKPNRPISTSLDLKKRLSILQRRVPISN